MFCFYLNPSIQDGSHASGLVSLDALLMTFAVPGRDDGLCQGLAQGLIMHIRQNSGTLSKGRRNKEFRRLTDDEIVTIEGMIQAAFDEYDTKFGISTP